MQEAVHKCVAERESVDAVRTRVIDFPVVTVSVVKYVKKEVEIGSVDKAKMEKRVEKLAEAVDEKTSKIKDRIETLTFDSVSYPSSSTDIINEKKANSKTYNTATSRN